MPAMNKSTTVLDRLQATIASPSAQMGCRVKFSHEETSLVLWYRCSCVQSVMFGGFTQSAVRLNFNHGVNYNQ